MSGYDKIDPIIRKWASEHNLHLCTQDRDWEVRSVCFLGGKKGTIEYQIWITEPGVSGKMQVHMTVKNSSHAQKIFEADQETLGQVLETAWRLATS